MQIAKIAYCAEILALLAHNRHERQIAFAGQSALAARKHPDTVGIQQQTDHHGGIKRWRPTSFLFVGRVEALQVQPGHRIDQEEHQVPLGEFARWALRLVLVALRIPGSIRFSTGLTHDGAPSVGKRGGSCTGAMIILYELLSDNYRSKSWPDAFVDSLLANDKRLPHASRRQIHRLPINDLDLLKALAHLK